MEQQLVAQTQQQGSGPVLMEGEELLYKSASLCPDCFKLIPMIVFNKDGRVLLRKTCKEHGTFDDVYWGDTEMFKKAKKYEVKGRGLENPAVTVNLAGKADHPICPTDCGLCSIHETHSGLTNMVITNRCDLTCWYCFFYAEAAGYIYEPTLDEIRWMVKNVANERPIAGNAFQITGGNPELREDICDIIKICKEEGIDHIQLNTNGTHKLYRDVEWTKSVRQAGVNTVYLSFDGVTPRTNPKNHWEIPGILDNCRQSEMGVVLVPTIINTVNDHEVGDILRFGFKHNDVVRGVNYQPVSLVGRMPKNEKDKYRITIPDVIKRIEEQTDGMVTRDAFYPVPCTVIFSQFIEVLKGHPKYELSINPACGMATYIFRDGKKMIPITDFVDVEGMFEYLKEKTEDMKNGASKYWIMAKLLYKLNGFIDKKKQPSWLNLSSVLMNVFLKHDYKALGAFHKNSLFVGMMHFQDEHNWDIQRIKKCDIHYVTPDKERPIIPFCTFNVIPQWYRDNVQKRFAISIAEWEKRTGKSLKEGYYKRNIKALEADPKYWKTYESFVKPKAIATTTVAQTQQALPVVTASTSGGCGTDACCSV